jgi:hypothetical protein
MRMAARLVLCTAVLSLVPAGAAFAQQYPPGSCSISTNVSSVQAGGSVTVFGTGFPTGPVDIFVNNQQVATANAASDFQVTIQIPANATPPFVIRAVAGDLSCAATLTPVGAGAGAGAGARAGAGAGGGGLAFTGSDMQLVWIGLVALMTGLALVVAARRRAASRSRLSTIS